VAEMFAIVLLSVKEGGLPCTKRGV
jgi:hypothetical protein